MIHIHTIVVVLTQSKELMYMTHHFILHSRTLPPPIKAHLPHFRRWFTLKKKMTNIFYNSMATYIETLIQNWTPCFSKLSIVGSLFCTAYHTNNTTLEGTILFHTPSMEEQMTRTPPPFYCFVCWTHKVFFTSLPLPSRVIVPHFLGTPTPSIINNISSNNFCS